MYNPAMLEIKTLDAFKAWTESKALICILIIINLIVKIMKQFRYFGLFILLVLSTSTVCAEENFIEIDVPYNNYASTPTIKVYIKDKGPFNFVIDTGASSSSISRELAEELNLSVFKQTQKKILEAREYSYRSITESINISISDKHLPRQTRFYVNDHKYNAVTKAVGILGVSELLGGTLKTFPTEKKLTLNLPYKIDACDPLNVKSYCYNAFKKMPHFNFTLGKEKGRLLIDTGYSGYTNIILFKNDYTNMLWRDKGNQMNDIDLNGLSELPVKSFRTHDFTFNEKPCAGSFLIRDPNDLSPKLSETYGVIGWNILSELSFKIDYKTGEIYMADSICPYTKKNTLGIKGIYTSSDFKAFYIESLTPNSAATKAGLAMGDKVEKIILANGKVFTVFDSALFNHNDQHIYAPIGSKITYFVRRDGDLKPFTMIAEGLSIVKID